MTPRALPAVVLAGGAGRRMGRPKATVVVPATGETLVERAVAIVRAAGCRPIIVSTRPEIALPQLDDDVVVVHDPGDALGPLVAIATAFEAIPPSSADDTIVLACDLPNAGPLVHRLVASPEARAVVARDRTGRVQPLCARYPRERALRSVRDALARGERRMMSLVDAIAPEAVAARGEELANVNRPDDLATSEPGDRGEIAAVDDGPIGEGSA